MFFLIFYSRFRKIPRNGRGNRVTTEAVLSTGRRWRVSADEQKQRRQLIKIKITNFDKASLMNPFSFYTTNKLQSEIKNIIRSCSYRYSLVLCVHEYKNVYKNLPKFFS